MCSAYYSSELDSEEHSSELFPPCVGILLPALWRPHGNWQLLCANVLHKQLGRTTSLLTVVTELASAWWWHIICPLSTLTLELLALLF